MATKSTPPAILERSLRSFYGWLARLGLCCALLGATSTFAAAQRFRQEVSETPFIERFSEHNDALWWRTDDRTGAKKINDTGFSARNISLANGELTLKLTGEPYRDRGHTGASYKSRDLYHYGRYDIVMKAARGSGVISAFFTYTGRPYGAPHDEIDFEFLGRDPQLLHLNYFVGGRSSLKKIVVLDFDASEKFHLYTIEWSPEEIIWSVDGQVLHRVTGSAGELPQSPGKVIANIWAGKNMKKWSGVIDQESLPARAFVRCISWRPPRSKAPTCADNSATIDESGRQ